MLQLQVHVMCTSMFPVIYSENSVITAYEESQ